MVKICKNPYTNPDIPPFSQYPFELDHFQKHTIEAIEKNIHVLNTAHTGSGKTLGAEYIIQKHCPLGKKVIYTAPIKRLSNQKFHEFSQKFPHISFGVLTGDIKFHGECVVDARQRIGKLRVHHWSDDLYNLAFIHVVNPSF